MPDESVSPPKFDLQDGLLAGGVLFSEAAAIVIWWPCALILAALYCFAGVAMIEKSKGSGRS